MNGQVSLFDLGLEQESRWVIETDNDCQMLKCEVCGCRIIRRWYDRAVGDRGYEYCPYCGKKMGNAGKMVMPWPGYKEEWRDTGKWIVLDKGEHGYSAGDFRCSVCGNPNKCYSLTDFCCNCGSWMRTDATRIPERGV